MNHLHIFTQCLLLFAHVTLGKREVTMRVTNVKGLQLDAFNP